MCVNKYVVVGRVHTLGAECQDPQVLLCGLSTTHAHLAEHWRSSEPDDIGSLAVVVSAGFWAVVDGEVQVEGSSDSLRRHSRDVDAQLIAQLINAGGGSRLRYRSQPR